MSVKSLKVVAVLSSVVVISSFVFGGMGCGNRTGEAEKDEIIADGPLPKGAFNARISIEYVPASIKTDSSSIIKLRVKNLSNTVWPSKSLPGGEYAINLGDHWLDKNGSMLIRDLDRSGLPRDVKPGEEVTMEINLTAPSTPGNYILEYDMVQEAVTWFARKGSKTSRVNVKVE